MNQSDFKDRANFGSTIDYHQAMFFSLQIKAVTSSSTHKIDQQEADG